MTTLIVVSCKKKNQPAKAAIMTGVEVISFPQSDNGVSWDVGSKADLTFQVSNVNQVLYSHPNSVNNVDNTNLPVFISMDDYRLPTIEQVYIIKLLDDDDTSGDDYIGEVSFNPNDYREDKPSIIERSSTEISLKIYMQWE